MNKENGCANCGGERVAKSTLCADCLFVATEQKNRGRRDLKKQIEKDGYIAATIIEERDVEIEELKYKYRILWRVTQKIFEEYQVLMKLYKRDGMKLDAINSSFRLDKSENPV